MPQQFTYSFSEPINPEVLQRLLKQTDWADKRQPLEIQQMLDNSQLVLGVWKDEQLIGFARVITDDIYRAWIEDVVVHQDYRKMGVGSHMLEKLLKRLEHVEDITLNCNHELIPFYEKKGFKNKKIACMHVWKG